MPTAPLLQRFVDDELAGAPALADGVLRGVIERLRSAPDRELLAGLRQRDKLFRNAFVTALRERITAELGRADGGTGMAPPSGLGGLALMDASRVEIDIEVSRATQAIETTADWELRELQTYTSALLGQAHVSAESNPLQPTVYAAALWDAGCAVFMQQAQQAAFLRLAAPACAAHLKTAWAAATARLARRGVTPSLYRTVILPTAAPGARASAAGEPASAHDPAVTARGGPLAPNPLRSLLATITDGGNRPAPPAARHPVAAADALRLSGPAASAADPAPQGAAVAVLLTQVFQALPRDALLHPAFVAPLAGLQIAALRSAALDPAAVVDSMQHPIWQLLDRIGEAGATYTGPGDARAIAIGTLCQRLADELNRSAAPNAELFRKALTRLDEFLAAQLQAQLRAAERPVAQLRQAERLQTLQDQLAQRLVEQMQPLRPSAAVRRFVLTDWSRVLATAMLRFGNEAPETQEYIGLVDDLLWSVQTPDHPASRQRLAGLLPGLLHRLQAGMALIALPPSEQQAILDELNHLHTAALSAGDAAGADPVARASTVHALLDLADLASRSATGRWPPPPESAEPQAGGPLIDGVSLETVPAELLPERLPAAGSASPQRQVARLQPGDRRRIFINGRWARLQLLWRSDAGGFFLFASEVAGQTHSITRSALERLAEVGLLTPLEPRPLVQRALASVARRAAQAAAAAPA